MLRRGFTRQFFKYAMEGALGIEARFVGYAEQGKVSISGIMHFAGNLAHAEFIDEIVEILFEPGIDDPGQIMRMDR